MRRWNEDPFTKRAQKEDYAARSVYKLMEIDKRERIFQGARTVMDLGASPGSWTQYALEKISKNAKVYAVDLAPLSFSDPRVIFVQRSIYDVNVTEWTEGAKVDLVLSDLAPKTSGIHDADVAQSIELAECAFNIALTTLRASGSLVVKLFMGRGFEDYQKLLRSEFETVRLLRPESTRKHSREIYFIARRLKNCGEAAPAVAPLPPKPIPALRTTLDS